MVDALKSKTRRQRHWPQEEVFPGSPEAVQPARFQGTFHPGRTIALYLSCLPHPPVWGLSSREY